MISEETQDQAALYALGLLDADEAAAFEHALAADGTLRTLTAELREAAASLARTDARGGSAPSHMRARVLAAVAAGEHGHPAAGKVVAGPWKRWLPQVAAAILMVCCGGLLWSGINLRTRYRDVVRTLHRDAEAAERTATWRAHGLEEQLRAAETNRLQQITFCALESVPAARQTGPQAAVLWDAAQRRGRLQIRKLPSAGTGKDYQLWAVEAGHKNPVSAGVIKVDPEGVAAMVFQPGPGDDVKSEVTAFALSVERAGGVPQNEGPILFMGKLQP